jgi:hypothetical protein
VVRDREAKVNSVKRKRIQGALLAPELRRRLEHFTAMQIEKLVL